MKQVIALALKDLRLMPRNKGGMFFTFVWPILMTVLFGLAFGGNGNNGEQRKIGIAVVDEDNTDTSREFLTKIGESFELFPMTRTDAANAVRLGDRTAYIVIKPGFGTASEQMFYGSPREIELGVDPRRQAESGMVEGLLMKHAAADMQKMFTDPAASARMADKALADIKRLPAGSASQVAPVERFLGELKTFMGTAAAAGPGAATGASNEWQPLKISAKDVAREYKGPQNAFDITFPQGVIWGLIGCVMTFGISLVTERTHGTLVRLRMAPLSRGQILGGKALACFVSIMFVEVMLLGLALALGVRPSSYPILALAGVSAAICFVGFMMLIASLGKTEQSASGAAWAIMMPLSMIGGAMVPQFVMPAWMQSMSVISPIRWTLLAIEGGIWRHFSINEMVLPCTILISVGIACFALGTRGLKEA
jgi:ABC-2 type transport system permease protein